MEVGILVVAVVEQSAVGLAGVPRKVLLPRGEHDDLAAGVAWSFGATRACFR